MTFIQDIDLEPITDHELELSVIQNPITIRVTSDQNDKWSF
jgi:hypothetical protein